MSPQPRTDGTNEDGYCIGRVYYRPNPKDFVYANLAEAMTVSTCEQWRERHPEFRLRCKSALTMATMDEWRDAAGTTLLEGRTSRN